MNMLVSKALTHTQLERAFSYRLDLARIDLDHSDSGCDKLLSQSVCEAADSSLSGTIDATTRVGLTTCNAANVDDISSATLISLLEDGQDRLSHVNQTGDVGLEHNVNVFQSNLGRSCYTLDEASTLVSIAFPNIFRKVYPYALFTSTLMSLNSSGRDGTKFFTSSGLLTSSWTGSTFTPSPTSSLIS